MNYGGFRRSIFNILQLQSKYCRVRCGPCTSYLARTGEIRPCRVLSISHFFLQRNKRRRIVKESIMLKTKSSKESIELYDDMSLRELAGAVKDDIDGVSEILLNINEGNFKFIENVDGPLPKKLIMDVAAAYNYKPTFLFRPSTKHTNIVEDILPQPPPSKDLMRRAPVITIMGHVDHGKTTLLDALRNSRIAAQEFGGITQHIGAFSVTLPKSTRKVTFLDTPGHAAFKAMRERGANSTDIVVLVVAADDGVKDQTIESIKYAKEAGVPLVVAVNKCDKPNANPQKAKEDLLLHGVVVEELGGDVQSVEISALAGTNLDQLQEALIIQADLMDLKSTPKGLVEGVVIESTTIQGLGKVCTMIVNRGTLQRNACLLSGSCWGRVKTMHDEFNKFITEAGPSTPVQISGWRSHLPSPGDIILEVGNEQLAEKVANMRELKKKKEEFLEDMEKIDEKRKEERERYLAMRREKYETGKVFVSTIRHMLLKGKRFAKEIEANPDAPPKMSLILRCDVDGTLEAILNVFDTYYSQMAELDLVDFGVGPPNTKNVEMAKEFKASIYCFNVPVPASILESAAKEEVPILTFNVIYKLIDTLKEDISSKLSPIVERKLVGEGHVLKQFMIPDGIKKKQPVAGVLVDSGVFDKKNVFRITRGEHLIYEGKIESMKRENEFVSSVGANMEVGIAVEDKTIRFKSDDTVDVFEEVVIPRQIDWQPPGF